MKKIIEVEINTEYIKLDQFLKYQGIASTGGEAKNIIMDGRIRVNDKVEYSRGKKLKPEDTVEYQGEIFKIV